jgi:methylmalonyl-CoA mutase N-terminal domain/subunit
MQRYGGILVSIETKRTRSGLLVQPTYTPADLDEQGFDYESELAAPGAWPFTRSPTLDGYLGQPWIMGQYSGYSSPRETNARFRRLLEQGQTGFSIALDLPTQMGLDSDHELAAGEVGKVGVPIDTVVDLEGVLDGIDLSKVRQIRTSANAIGPIIQAMLVIVAERQGISPTDFRVMLQNDVLKEYIARGTYIFPPEHGLRFSVDVIEYAAANMPNWEPIEFCGYHIRDSGCTAVQEVALAMANGLAYLEEAHSRGVDIASVAGSLVFFLSADLELFEEVAKFRATRRLWSRLLHERFGVEPGTAGGPSIFCYTLGGSLAAREPMNNIVRVAYQSLAAALGNVQTLATSSFDEALGLPSEEAVALSLRTQQILAYETGVTSTVDPLAGSYYVESLTNQIEGAVRKQVVAIDQVGGSVKAIESGYLQRLIADEAFATHRRIESGERVIVGVNRFATDGQPQEAVSVFRVPEEAEQEQRRNLAAVRRQRDGRELSRALGVLRDDARRGVNLVPALIVAARAHATVGEMCDVLRDIWGTHRAATAFI